MGDVSLGVCSGGRVPARNRAGLGMVVGSVRPRRRSNMSGAGRKSLPWRARGVGQSTHTGSRGQGERGTQVGGKRGEGTTAFAPPTRGLLGTGPGFQPHRNRNPRNSPVRLHSTLSFFWSERETDRNKEEEDQESQASYSLAQTPGMPGSTQKPGPHGGVPPRPSHTPSLVSASSEVGLAGTCIHTGCVLPGTFPPADCSDTGS